MKWSSSRRFKASLNTSISLLLSYNQATLPFPWSNYSASWCQIWRFQRQKLGRVGVQQEHQTGTPTRLRLNNHHSIKRRKKLMRRILTRKLHLSPSLTTYTNSRALSKLSSVIYRNTISQYRKKLRQIQICSKNRIAKRCKLFLINTRMMRK